MIARRGAHDEAVNTLREARAELDRRATVLRSREGRARARASSSSEKRAIDAEAARRCTASAPQPVLPAGRPATEADLHPGRVVFVARFGGRASVLERPRNGKVLVQAGALKIAVPLDEIHLPGRLRRRNPARSERGHNAYDLSVRQPQTEKGRKAP